MIKKEKEIIRLEEPTLLISGVDDNNIIRALRTDKQGRIQIYPSPIYYLLCTIIGFILGFVISLLI